MSALRLAAIALMVVATHIGGFEQKAYAKSIDWPSWFHPSDFGPCQWRGKAPICRGKCESGETEIVKDKSGGGHSCRTGSKSYCCQPKQ